MRDLPVRGIYRDGRGWNGPKPGWKKPEEPKKPLIKIPDKDYEDWVGDKDDVA